MEFDWFQEEDRRHGELQHAAGVPSSLSALSRPLASFNQFSIGPTGAGYSNGSGHIGFVAFGSGSSSAGSSQSVGVVGHAPLLSGSGAGGMPSLGPSPIPSVVSQASGSGSGNATVGLPGSVMRAQLPPISHKRDAASANINRVLAVRRRIYCSASLCSFVFSLQLRKNDVVRHVPVLVFAHLLNLYASNDCLLALAPVFFFLLNLAR